MTWTGTVAIISIMVPSLLAGIVNFDPNVVHRSLDDNLLRKQVPEGCDEEESVKLSRMHLTDIPKHAVRSRSIRSITLENNWITRVPEDMFEDVPNLECLNLARNNIPFARLLNFKHEVLKVLIVNHQGNGGSYESRDMANDTDPDINVVLQTSEAYFPNLESLHLNGVNFEFFHPYFNESFPRLTTLYMADNHLTYIKRNMLSRLPSHLKSLHLERNDLKTMYLEHMGNVEELYLDGNPLVDLQIYDSTNNLRTLSLSNCSLEGNMDIFKRSFPFLTALDLSYNRIRELHTNALQNIPSLEALSLSHNELATFPYLRYLANLRSLSLSGNFIEHVPSLVMPSSLNVLSLRGNRISSIDVITFSDLRLLEELDLSMNKLQALPPGWAEDMKALRYLNLGANQFASIADMMVTSLSALNELQVKGNVFKTIDEYSLQLIPSYCTVYVI